MSRPTTTHARMTRVALRISASSGARVPPAHFAPCVLDLLGHARPPDARGRGATHLVRDARGQASVELIAGVPALLLAGVVALQLLAVGYSLTLADGAAEAGALAVAVGRPAAPAVEEALPGWAERRVDVQVDGGEVSVRLRPPAPLAGLSERLAVTSSSWVRRPAEE